MNKLKQIFNILSFIECIFLIIYLNLGTTLISANVINYRIFSKGLQIIGIIFFILYIIYKILNERKIKIKDILVILMVIFLLISYHFAYNKETALIGEIGRNEGLLTILSYYSFFLLSSTLNKKDIKKLINLFIITCIYQIIIGIIQIFKITNIFGYDRSNNWSTNFSIASGTHGNPNFYSTYVLMGLLCVYNSFLKEKDKLKKIIYLILTIIFIYGLLIGNTLSCILTFILLFVITIIIKVFKEKQYKILIYIIIALILFLLMIFTTDHFTKNRLSKKIKSNYEEISSILTSGVDEHTGNERIYIWKTALSNSSEYLFTGIGIDNFSYIDDGTYICTDVKGKFQCFDKAHNEYIQIFITEGIFALLTYLFILTYIFIKGNKKSVCYLMFIGYLMQAIFNISVINVAPLFYMIMGFLISIDKERT